MKKDKCSNCKKFLAHYGRICKKCYNQRALTRYHTEIKHNPEKLKNQKQKSKEWQQACRLEVLQHYSKREVPECGCCGEKEYKFLSIDHVHGGGWAHRKKIFGNGRTGGSAFAWWLRKNNFPEGYEVLCYNCNCSKGFWGECPHRQYISKV